MNVLLLEGITCVLFQDEVTVNVLLLEGITCVLFQDEVTVNVVLLEGIRIFAPLKRLQTDTQV